MYSLFRLVDTLLIMYSWILIISAVLSWLIVFDVVNARNHFVRRVTHFLSAVTEPLLRPIRRLLPAIQGVDLSPLVLFLIIYLIRSLMYEYWLGWIFRV